MRAGRKGGRTSSRRDVVHAGRSSACRGMCCQHSIIYSRVHYIGRLIGIPVIRTRRVVIQLQR